MPKIIRTARGEQIDFDAVVIKQQIAQAPMNIEVARRKEFIDSKEGKARGQRKPSFITGDGTPDPNAFVTGETVRQVVINDAVSVKAPSPTPADFEVEGTDGVSLPKGPIEAIPDLPDRKK